LNDSARFNTSHQQQTFAICSAVDIKLAVILRKWTRPRCR